MAAITAIQLQSIMPSCSTVTWWRPLVEAMAGEIDVSVFRQAAFLATVAVESGECHAVAENLNYSAEALLRMWPRRFTAEEATDYARQPSRIAARVYALRNGNGSETSADGWTYRGRGLLQITGRFNYGECGEYLRLDLVGQPELLEHPTVAAKSAAWYFSARGCIAQADERDFRGVSGIVNCGSASTPTTRINGWNARLAYYDRALSVLGRA
jgi:putative chitinase